MRSKDFPGNPSSKAIAGLRTPEAIPEPHGSRVSARAAMLAGMNVEPVADHLPANAPLEGEYISRDTILADIPVKLILRSPYQPRLVFDEKSIEELATSIQTIGLGKPIIVRRVGDKYELVGGERRLRAVLLNGGETIKAVIHDMSDSIAMILALTDNGGEDLTDYEHARSYHRILQDGEEKSQRALARRLGVNVSIVNRCLTLMQLPESIRTVLDNNPKLITSNYAKRFVDHAQTHSLIVEKTVHAMVETGLQQEAALRLIEREISSLNKNPDAQAHETKKVQGVGSLRIAGSRLEFKCEKGIDPQRLSKQFEEFLRALDIDSVRSEAP